MILRMNYEHKSSATAKKSIKNIPCPYPSDCMKWNIFDLMIWNIQFIKLLCYPMNIMQG